MPVGDDVEVVKDSTVGDAADNNKGKGVNDVLDTRVDEVARESEKGESSKGKEKEV